MGAAEKCLMIGGVAGNPQGQVVFEGVVWSPGVFQGTASGFRSWVVPNGVTSISVVAVGSGCSGGGALAYRNNIPVTPGETLTVYVGSSYSSEAFEKGLMAGYDASRADDSYLSRGDEILVLAKGGKDQAVGARGAGGQAAECVGDVAFSGGSSGLRSSTTAHWGAGGGAAGYAVNGGLGASNSSDGDLDDGHRTGGGGGGIGLLGLFEGEDGLTPTGGGAYYGGGAGAYRGANGPSLSNNDGVDDPPPAKYGGSMSTVEASDQGSGAIRIIWGEGREFPYSADDVEVISI